MSAEEPNCYVLGKGEKKEDKYELAKRLFITVYK